MPKLPTQLRDRAGGQRSERIRWRPHRATAAEVTWFQQLGRGPVRVVVVGQRPTDGQLPSIDRLEQKSGVRVRHSAGSPSGARPCAPLLIRPYDLVVKPKLRGNTAASKSERHRTWQPPRRRNAVVAREQRNDVTTGA